MALNQLKVGTSAITAEVLPSSFSRCGRRFKELMAENGFELVL